MRHIKRSKLSPINNSNTVIFEYASTLDMNLAHIHISGRYPAYDYTINTKVDALVYVISGHGTFVTFNESIQLAHGDQVEILKNEAYYFDGNLDIVYVSSPHWALEQAKIVSKNK